MSDCACRHQSQARRPSSHQIITMVTPSKKRADLRLELPLSSGPVTTEVAALGQCSRTAHLGSKARRGGPPSTHAERSQDSLKTPPHLSWQPDATHATTSCEHVPTPASALPRWPQMPLRSTTTAGCCFCTVGLPSADLPSNVAVAQMPTTTTRCDRQATHVRSTCAPDANDSNAMARAVLHDTLTMSMLLHLLHRAIGPVWAEVIDLRRELQLEACDNEAGKRVATAVACQG